MMIGYANESSIQLDGYECKALLDTGSTVSTMSISKYNEIFSDKPIQPLNHLNLDIEGAGGHNLPYSGYIETEVTVPGLSNNVNCLMLIVPDTRYAKRVPVILGTNVLTPVMETARSEFGIKFQQKANLSGSWHLVFRCMCIQHREAQRANGRLCIVKSAVTHRVVIPSNSTVTLDGKFDKMLTMPSCLGVMQYYDDSTLPADVEVTPALVNYDHHDTSIPVQVSNLTTSPVVISPNSVICQLQACDLDMDMESMRQELPGRYNSDTLNENIDLTESVLTEDQVTRVRQFLGEWSDVFSANDLDIGFTSVVKHKINLTDDQPFKQRHRKIPASMYNEVKQHLQELLDAGVIRKSHSPWASNIVLVRKKDKSLRLCVDYRQLNKRTIRDAYALPRINDLLDSLGGAKYFSVLDMKSGYHQVGIEPSHKPRTAFTVGPLGFYEYNRLPFGLSNAPATYQRMMEEVLYDLNHKVCQIYLDDVIITGNTFEEHLERLEQVLSRFRECGMKLSPKKCHLFKDRVRYVGHIVSSNGIETDPDKTEKVSNWPEPTNVAELRTFLGFSGYYRRFIKDFARIARPLNVLLTGHGPKKKGKKRKIPEIPSTWQWTELQQNAFDQLKVCLTSPPVLSYPDFSTKKFHDYLYGNEFLVYTDNNPLTYVTTSAKLDATGHRWIAALGAYNFEIKYRSGKQNSDADGLSRIPQSATDNTFKQVSHESVKALCQNLENVYVDTICMSASVLDIPELDSLDDVQNPTDWRKHQMADPTVKCFLRAVTNKQKPKLSDIPGTEGKSFLKEFTRLVVRRGVLYRHLVQEGEDKYQLILPQEFRNIALRGSHNDLGHLGRDRGVHILRSRFYWPGMNKDLEEWIRICDRCVKHKTPANSRAPLVSISTSQPLELVCMDYLTLEMSKGGYQNILVLTDHFTTYAVAIPTGNQTAKTTAEALFNSFIVHYGFPKRIHSDQGANFESGLIKELCTLSGMSKSRTTPYHPAGNGITERMNRSLLSMLGTLDPARKHDWKSEVSPLVHAYNCTKHETTGFAPYFLMFGRQPRLAMDVVLGLTNTDVLDKNYGKYNDQLKARLNKAYELASANTKVAQARQKGKYDEKSRGAVVETGDRVLVKVVAYDGKHKIADRWEDIPYTVLDQPNGEIPVYVVQRENKVGPKRTLHRNLLLPIGFLPFEETSPSTVVSKKTVVQETTQSDITSDTSETEDEADDTEQDYIIVNSVSGVQVDNGQGNIQNINTQDQGDVLGINPQEQVGTDEQSVIQEPIQVPTPAPRRSQRNRRPPDKYASGEFIMAQRTSHASQD